MICKHGLMMSFVYSIAIMAHLLYLFLFGFVKYKVICTLKGMCAFYLPLCLVLAPSMSLSGAFMEL